MDESKYGFLGLEKNPNLRVLVQASWAPRDGRLVGNFTNAMRDIVTADEIGRMREAHQGWLKQLEAQVSALNTSLGTGTTTSSTT